MRRKFSLRGNTLPDEMIFTFVYKRIHMHLCKCNIRVKTVKNGMRSDLCEFRFLRSGVDE